MFVKKLTPVTPVTNNQPKLTGLTGVNFVVYFLKKKNKIIYIQWFVKKLTPVTPGKPPINIKLILFCLDKGNDRQAT